MAMYYVGKLKNMKILGFSINKIKVHMYAVHKDSSPCQLSNVNILRNDQNLITIYTAYIPGHCVSIFIYLQFTNTASHVRIRLCVVLLRFGIASLCRHIKHIEPKQFYYRTDTISLLKQSCIIFILWQYHAQCLGCPPLSPVTLSVCLSLLEPENSNGPSVVL